MCSNIGILKFIANQPKQKLHNEQLNGNNMEFMIAPTCKCISYTIQFQLQQISVLLSFQSELEGNLKGLTGPELSTVLGQTSLTNQLQPIFQHWP